VLGWRVRAAVVVAVLSLGLIGAAFAVDAYEERGAETTAKVTSCETRYKLPPLCRGTWVEGDLLEGGRVVFGEEIAVRSDGDSAWTITNRLPYILGSSGVAVALIGVGAALRRALGRNASIGTNP